MGRANVADVPGRPQAASYPPYIWDGYEGCRSARAFEARLRVPVGSVFCDRSVTERPARAYEMDIGRPTLDALTRKFGTLQRNYRN